MIDDIERSEKEGRGQIAAASTLDEIRQAETDVLGKKAPKPGLLIDTKTFGCQGAAGSFICQASYEPLPKGKYTWKIAWVGTPKKAAHVELTVRW